MTNPQVITESVVYPVYNELAQPLWDELVGLHEEMKALTEKVATQAKTGNHHALIEWAHMADAIQAKINAITRKLEDPKYHVPT